MKRLVVDVVLTQLVHVSSLTQAVHVFQPAPNVGLVTQSATRREQRSKSTEKAKQLSYESHFLSFCTAPSLGQK